jgi:hypothetical protein
MEYSFICPRQGFIQSKPGEESDLRAGGCIDSSGIFSLLLGVLLGEQSRRVKCLLRKRSRSRNQTEDHPIKTFSRATGKRRKSLSLSQSVDMEEGATTAALIGLLYALTKFVEKGIQRSNGGSVEYRLAALESQIETMQQTVKDFQRAFYEFREESRIWRATRSGDNND